MLVGLLAYRIGRRIVERLTRQSPVLKAMVVRTDGPLPVLLPLAALAVVLDGAPDDAAGHRGPAPPRRRAAHRRHSRGSRSPPCAAWPTPSSCCHPQDVADNLQARRILTQTRVLSRIAIAVLLFAGARVHAHDLPAARASSAPACWRRPALSALVIGLAARSVFSNLLAGLQIALSQPIRIDDVLIVEGEWGRVEEITGTYVVLKIWDERRLIIPLQWFIENPFQNWTRTTRRSSAASCSGSTTRTELEPLRAEATRLAKASKDYDGRVCLLQVVDTSDRSMQLRLIVSSPSAGQNWDLRCLLREGLIGFLQREQPQALPRVRAELQRARRRATATACTPRPTRARRRGSCTVASPAPGCGRAAMRR